MKKKAYIIWIGLIIIIVISIIAVLLNINNRIDKDQLVGSWYIEGDDSPFFKLKKGGKAKAAFAITTDSNGQRHVGLCDASCKWKIKNGHLVLVSIMDIDMGRIINIEDNLMICEEDDGTVVKYVKKKSINL